MFHLERKHLPLRVLVLLFFSILKQTLFSFVRVMLKGSSGPWLFTQRSQCLLQAVTTEVSGNCDHLYVFGRKLVTVTVFTHS